MSLGLCAVPAADAQPITDLATPRGDDDSTAKILRLEGRIQTLEARIRELEQLCPEPKRKAPKTNNAKGAAAPNNTASRAPSECNPPFFVDTEGLRRVRQECIQSPTNGSCDDPFVIDASGIKRVKLACVNQ